MPKLRSLHYTLQEQLSPNDTSWKYTLPALPSPTETKEADLIKSLAFVSSLTKQGVYLHLASCPSNRITKNEPLHLMLLCSFADFRLRQSNPSKDGKVLFAPSRDSTEYVVRLLKTGVVLNGIRYHFFGHSNSQTKSRSCFMYAASKDDISAKIERLGDFSNMKSVGKKAKRIGLLFSSAEAVTTLSPGRYQDIDDITNGEYTFTDGCGLISNQLARLIAQRRNIVFLNQKYLPSVCQIRYRGYKGVLTLHPELQGQIQVQFRESMRKFKDASDLSLSVVEYSKPYTFGYLNDEIVLLLHALGIPNDTLIRKQTEYLQFLRGVFHGDSRAAFRFLSYQGEIALAEKLLLVGVDVIMPSLRGLVRQEHARMLNKYEEQRCRIMIPDSRLLFGVCDPSGKPGTDSILRPGTCFVRITSDGDGLARTLINTEVLVTRNPCLHPGDLQKFRAVDIPEYSHLVDCIVFPTCGPRPSADLMSGGDLDGDKFFVTWDPEIIPSTISQPAAYPGVKERIEFKKITDDDRAEFFAKYNNASLGRVKNLYLKWARLIGPMSAECQQLNRLFSQCVDGNRIRVPQNLEDPPEPTVETPRFILDVLHNSAATVVANLATKDPKIYEYSGDVLDLLASRDRIAMSEFHLIQQVLRKCEWDNTPFDDYAHVFNYSALNDEQQIWLLSRLPPNPLMPSLVCNGLLQSDLVTPTELRRFQLHHPRLHWRPVFSSSTDRMARFLSVTSRSLELFYKKLIVFKADERLTLMVYVPSKIAQTSEVQVDAAVRVFAVPHSAPDGLDYFRVMPTNVNSRLYCDERTFRLYEHKRSNTFIYLTKVQLDKTTTQDVTVKHDQRKQLQATIDEGINYDCRASVALNKIGGSVQEYIGRMNRAGILGAEIYVISNRDVESMRYLDQWLHHIDTEAVLPLFPAEKPDYRVPTLEEVDREAVSLAAREVVFDRNVSRLRDIGDTTDIREILQLLTDAKQTTYLRTVFGEVLNLGASNSMVLDQNSLMTELLDFLPRSVVLTQTLLESEFWRSSKDSCKNVASAIFPMVLQELVLSTNDLQAFVRQPFRLVLGQLHQLSVQSLADLIEMISLTVHDSELALDLLIECIEPETSRLLVGRPLEVSQITKALIGIALDHIDEAGSAPGPLEHTLRLQRVGTSASFEVVKSSIRIDATETAPKIGDHIRFLASTSPMNAPFERPYSMDTVVISSEQGSLGFRCLHHPPSFLTECTWQYKSCGSFVTAKTMIGAVIAFYAEKEAACGLYKSLVGLPTTENTRPKGTQHAIRSDRLNDFQNAALNAAINQPLAFLWGPPGTGKTHTIVVILKELFTRFKKSRFLVTAPTHNAVDNILQHLMKVGIDEVAKPLRVSTSLAKVAPSLRHLTCDAMVGKDLSSSFAGHRQVLKRIKESRLFFTTCVGAGLGNLRAEKFDIVLVDEASQQTEPATLIPLTKGCQRAILVGDHVQLRATVQKHAVVSGFDISLFERHYEMPLRSDVAKVMLQTQYRMHPDICSFSSAEFYQSRLATAPGLANNKIPTSQFPWPANDARKVFIQCSSPEDLGRQSKSNAGQVALCQHICKRLTASTKSSPAESSPSKPDIAILTPYSNQRTLLAAAMPSYNVSSIDGYQGREADIIVFVTVRCNNHFDIGFLKDLRRLNVAMTRAKAGVIIIGDRRTLIGSAEGDDTDVESKAVWRRLLDSCTEVKMPGG